MSKPNWSEERDWGQVGHQSRQQRASSRPSAPVTARPASTFNSTSRSVPQSLNSLGTGSGGASGALRASSKSVGQPTSARANVSGRREESQPIAHTRRIVRSSTMDSVNNNNQNQQPVNNNLLAFDHVGIRSGTGTGPEFSDLDFSLSHRRDFDLSSGNISRASSSSSTATANPFANPYEGKEAWLKRLKTLYARLLNKEMSEEEIQTSLNYLQDAENNRTECFSAFQACEKLKIHLNRRGRKEDADKFIKLYKQLQTSPSLTRKEGVLEFLYRMFDIEPSRAAFASASARPMTMARGSISPPKTIKQELAEAAAAAAVEEKDKNQVLNGSPKRAAVTGVKAAVANYADRILELQHSPSSTSSSVRLSASPRKSDVVLLDQDHPNVTLRRSGQHDIRIEDIDTKDAGNETPERDFHGLPPNAQDLREPIFIPRMERPSDQLLTRTEINRSNCTNSELNASNMSSHTNSTFFNNSANTNGSANANARASVPVFLDPNQRVNTNYMANRRSLQSTTTGAYSNYKPMGFGYQTYSSSDQAAIERDLVNDLVYMFQGINGKYLKLKGDDKYEVDLGEKSLTPPLRMQALRLCELGYAYRKIKNWCDKPTTELMTQGFKHALQKELQEFYRVLALIQSTIQKTSVDTPMSEENSKSRKEDLSLLKLTVWVFESRARLDMISSMVETCEGKKGGEICSVLFRYTQHGDPMIASASCSILSVVAKPMYLMLCQWILYGELEDPNNEFFIAADTDCKMEHLWHSMYRIREKMLPTFISKSMAERILATGKNINFLKHICQNKVAYAGRDDVQRDLQGSPVECIFLEDDQLLNKTIDLAYRTTSEMVLNVLIHEARLLDHLKAIKHYLLLGQGDFIQYLLELLQDELSKPASKIFSHNLSGILESAVRATNAQFEDEDILSRLDTRILLQNDCDLGWDVFCLDYKALGPIGTVLTEDAMDSYNKLFNALWRTKRIEAMLSTLWKNQTALFKCQKTIPELGTVLHRSQLLISEMIHFVHQTQYYIMFEATECAWDFLMEKVEKAKDLDQVISAHEEFIQTITRRSLLDISKRELMVQLRGIFGIVHELKKFLEDFENAVMNEMKRRKPVVPTKGGSRGGSKSGSNTSLASQTVDVEANKQFFTACVSDAKARIEALYSRTQDMVRHFLLHLNKLQDSDSLTLQCLSFRLDFNEYYALKDPVLSFPLTFQHRRRSSNQFSPCPSLSTSAIGLGGSGGHGHALGISQSITEGMEY